jgi:hypothetical protein
MPQIFQPRANVLSRTVLVGLLVAVLAGAALLEAMVLLPYVTLEGIVPKGTRVGFTPEQPVPFSHKHHVGDVGIDCRYCHISVERSWFAGLPPTHTCMTCHSQFLAKVPMLAPLQASMTEDIPLRWVKVANLPDYVYFDHSIHVAKGVGCETCHGRVDKLPMMRQMYPFTMEFCLSCHRDPQPYLRPKDEIFAMGWKLRGSPTGLGRRLMTEYRIDTRSLTNCSTCHR